MSNPFENNFTHDVDRNRIEIAKTLQSDRERAALGIGLCYHQAFFLAQQSHRQPLSAAELKVVNDVNWALRILEQEELDVIEYKKAG